ncbi:rhodanese-like domain-containing protein [Persicimonas caeni]|uniref:Rhodanese-like domain-containing protein n=1 Tax=Persicimonas caeni TaxID=2292766 RepID=A0A4Y6PPT0_PERCE|nr:rhodanese-like domain-containing protein [Persicimonas caeni]QDG50007.1 rhodanese-like domain-containing protein [Persicimonas caeni]QED31228.1 rhodanese-like domain-containing protein [Persicimonas caeni]
MSTTTFIIVAALTLVAFYILRKTQSLDPEKRREILDALEKGATLVDVRTRQEFDSGHPEGAINVPLHQLQQDVKGLKRKPRPIVVTCASGMRSARAAKLLRRSGIEVLDLGGRANWPR